MKRKNVVILGSTGSIGINTLKVIERFPDRFRVVGLTAYNNFKLLARQVARYQPRYVAANKKDIAFIRANGAPRNVKFFDVEEGLSFIVSQPDVDVIVIAMRGSAALEPFLAAARCGKTICPANKEALVVGGHILMAEARRHGANVIPIDSEQSAIFQCLEGRPQRQLKKIWLTASGGALLKVAQSRFDSLTVEEILKHPRWKMGKKITVDSATLMNKGFEVIEAIRLFGIDHKQIEVVIHPEAIIHSMIELKDGSIIAQLGITDMRLPIQYALTFPDRWPTGLKTIDFFELKHLTFERPDVNKFPALQLALHTAKKGGTLPSVLNAADEIAVEAFLEGKIKFSKIYTIVEKVVLKHHVKPANRIQDILAADQWARAQAQQWVEA